MKIINWTCTDPDQHQYGRRIAEGVYEFREFDRAEHGDLEEQFDSSEKFIKAVWDELVWNEVTIVVEHYSEQELRKAVSGYYSEREISDMFKDGLSEDDEWIVAECLFEQQ